MRRLRAASAQLIMTAMKTLVSTQWLADNLDAQDIVILDASAHLPDADRDPGAEFNAEHIPGARFLDLPSLIDPDSSVPAALPTGAIFARRMSDLGVKQTDRIILYDDSYVKTAARAWFILRQNGVIEVAILDGGLGKWRAEGRPVTSGAPAISPTAFAAGSGRVTVRSKADLLANLESKAEQVVDARGAKRVTGESPDFRPEVASGHIPHSRNLPFDLLFNEDGTYKDEAAIKACFADAGVDLDQPITTTCGGGVTAAVLLFALHLAGKHDVALYDGSWSEWGTDPDTPKATGEAS